MASLAELIDAAPNPDERWQLIGDFVRDGVHAAFVEAVKLLSSPITTDLVLGAEVMSQVATVAPELAPEAAQSLLQALPTADDASALSAIVTR